jgi:ligand-binding sensor domain-containing protein
VGSDLGAPYLFDRITGKFYNFNEHCAEGDKPIIGVWGFLEDCMGGIWLSAKEGYYKLDEDRHRFDCWNQQLGITDKVFASSHFATDRLGTIWFTTTDGLKCYDLRSKQLSDKHHNPAKLKIFDLPGLPDDIQVDADNNTWLDTYNTGLLYKFTPGANTIRKYDFSGKKKPSPIGLSVHFPGRISKGRDGHILVSLAAAGMALYHPEKDSFTIIPIDDKNPYSLHGNPEFINIDVLTDREGNCWVATDKGINIFNPDRQYFSYFGSHNSESGPTGFPTGSASGFWQDSNGDLYVSFYNEDVGILRLDSNLRVQQQYLLGKRKELKEGRNQLWCLLHDNHGILWAPNQHKTILTLDTHDGREEEKILPALSGNINTMQQDAEGNIWIGHWTKGLIKMDGTTHDIHQFDHPPGIGSYPLKKIYCLCPDEDSILWAGSDQGLLRFNKSINAFTAAYVFDKKNRQSISNNIVKNILPYGRDTLLIATSTGLNIFDRRKKIFSVISTEDGLPNDFVQTMALDNLHNLWVGCAAGFCRINIPSRTITNYDFSDGIVSATFDDRPFFTMKNGNFLVPETSGFMIFNPDNFREKTPPPDVCITGIGVFDKAINADSVIGSGYPLTLAYTDNNITIEFSSLQFTTPDKLRYAYQLVGVDKDWVTAGKDRVARYNQLRSGHYLFTVKCTDRNGIQCKGITRLSLYIVPPFWNTWWFYACVILLTTGTIYWVAKQIQDKRKEKQLLQLHYEKKIAVMEMNTLRAQMSPHFIFNSLNSINTFILKNDRDNASGYLSKFSQLVRMILDNSRTEWVLLANELKALKLYIELESLRLNKSFSYAIHVEPDVAVSQTMVPPLIIQPYVENAIWHGLSHRKVPGGMITIHILKDSSVLKVQITDNGVGRAEAAKIESRNNTRHKSHGMKITAERLAIVNEVYKVNAAVTVTDHPDAATGLAGTRVLLTIQYKTYASSNH